MGFEVQRDSDRARWGGSDGRRDRKVDIAVALAVLLHLIVVGLYVLAHRYPLLLASLEPKPPEVHQQADDDQDPAIATVELVKQDTETSGGDHLIKKEGEDSKANPSPPSPPQQSASGVPPPETDKSDAPLPPPAPEAPLQKKPNDIKPEGEQGTGIVMGDAIVPAAADARYKNPSPTYPEEAARLHQQGTVGMIIHIGPTGLPLWVDVIRSSGSASIDEAARKGVLRWHFNPATRGGQPIESILPFEISFSLK